MSREKPREHDPAELAPTPDDRLYSLALRPSPEEIARDLPVNEQVALDLILELTMPDDCCVWDGKRYQDLRALVPDASRRGYLGTLCKQLRESGASIRPRTEGSPW